MACRQARHGLEGRWIGVPTRRIGAWVADQEVAVSRGKITEYKVRLKVTFILED
jgi:hypothetical protein